LGVLHACSLPRLRGRVGVGVHQVALRGGWRGSVCPHPNLPPHAGEGAETDLPHAGEGAEQRLISRTRGNGGSRRRAAGAAAYSRGVSTISTVAPSLPSRASTRAAATRCLPSVQAARG